jgi:hypothetical protein
VALLMVVPHVKALHLALLVTAETAAALLVVMVA